MSSQDGEWGCYKVPKAIEMVEEAKNKDERDLTMEGRALSPLGKCAVFPFHPVTKNCTILKTGPTWAICDI